MARANDSELLARLDERTLAFGKTLDFIAAENRDLSNKMLAALERHSGDDKDNFKKHDDEFGTHDDRLKKLENWQANMMGRWLMLTAVAGLVAGIVSWALK